MSLPVSIDVLIVGAGPVGVTLGNLLGRYGVSALIIDKASGILAHPRAIALDNEALRILQMAGLGEDAFARVAIPVVKMHSPYFGEFARFKTTGCLDGHPKLVTFFQPELEHALRRQMQSYPQIALAQQTELVSFTESTSGIDVELQCPDGSRHMVNTRYLIGADGASSRVRELLELGFQGSTYIEDWLIIDASKTAKPMDHIEFNCDPKRPTPHMPAPDGRERWEFMLQPGESREQMLQTEKIRELLAPWARPDEVIIERSAVYRFHARVVSKFQKGRAFLIGDAAHITPPFVGQGLCAGLRDAANLGWKLAWVINSRAAPQILDTYDLERRQHAADMIGLATLMGKLIMPSNAVKAFLTHGLVRMLRSLPVIGAWIDDLKMKPENRFKQGLMVPGEKTTALVRGSHFPQALLRHADGTFAWSDDVLGDHLSLVGFGIDPATLLSADDMSRWHALGGHCIQLCYRGQALNRSVGKHVWEDINGEMLPGLAPTGWLAVVRPDHSIITDGPSSEAAHLIEASIKLLCSPTPAHLT